MRLTKTRWMPDTCGCVLEYEWDADSAEDAREHRVVLAVPCPEHAGAATAAVSGPEHKRVWDAVIGENTRKNRGVAALMAQGVAVDAIRFEHDANRRLVLKVKRAAKPALKAGTTLQSVVDAAVGKGHATVVEE